MCAVARQTRRLAGYHYWWNSGFQFWLFTLYDKDEMADLTPKATRNLKALIKAELEMRRKI